MGTVIGCFRIVVTAVQIPRKPFFLHSRLDVGSGCTKKGQPTGRSREDPGETRLPELMLDNLIGPSRLRRIMVRGWTACWYTSVD